MTLEHEEIEDMTLDVSEELIWDDLADGNLARHLILAPMFEEKIKPFFGYTEDDGVSWIDTYAVIDFDKKKVTSLYSVFVDNVNHKEKELKVSFTNSLEMEEVFQSLDREGNLSEIASSLVPDSRIRCIGDYLESDITEDRLTGEEKSLIYDETESLVKEWLSDEDADALTVHELGSMVTKVRDAILHTKADVGYEAFLDALSEIYEKNNNIK